MQLSGFFFNISVSVDPDKRSLGRRFTDCILLLFVLKNKKKGREVKNVSKAYSYVGGREAGKFPGSMNSEPLIASDKNGDKNRSVKSKGDSLRYFRALDDGVETRM